MADKTTQIGMFDTPNKKIKTKPSRRKAHTHDNQKRVGRFLHLGGGRQSSALVYMILKGELEPVDAVLFADTGDEPQWVYDQVDYLRSLLESAGIPLVLVSKGAGMIEDAMSDSHGRFASMPLFTRDPDTGKVGQLRRQCTSEYKIQPLEGYIRGWLVERGHGKLVVDKNGRKSRRINADVYVEDIYGISYDEWWRSGNRGAKWQKALYPLIDKQITAADCVKYSVVNGYKIAKKSSCRVCPFHDNEYWLDLKTNHPDDFEHACQFDEWMRTPAASKRFMRNMKQMVYLHRSCQPLREIDFEALVADKLKPAPLMEMCGDHCFV